MLDQTFLDSALSAVGDLLEERKQHVEVVAIGGGGLLLLGLIERSTKDLDLVGLRVGEQLAAWVVTHDPSEGFRLILDQVLSALGAGESDA